jgi:hypothetical protein
MAGGSEVMEAATKKIVMPTPSSTSAKRRRRRIDPPGLPARLRTTRKLP